MISTRSNAPGEFTFVSSPQLLLPRIAIDLEKVGNPRILFTWHQRFLKKKYLDTIIFHFFYSIFCSIFNKSW